MMQGCLWIPIAVPVFWQVWLIGITGTKMSIHFPCQCVLWKYAKITKLILKLFWLLCQYLRVFQPMSWPMLKYSLTFHKLHKRRPTGPRSFTQFLPFWSSCSRAKLYFLLSHITFLTEHHPWSMYRYVFSYSKNSVLIQTPSQDIVFYLIVFLFCVL